MAALTDRATMLGAFGRRLFGFSPASSEKLEIMKLPAVRASVGASFPRSSSPKKNRDGDRRPRTPASLTEAANPSLSLPLFRDSAQVQLPPSQRLEAPRAASICEAPPSREHQRWGYFFEDENATVHTPPTNDFDFDSIDGDRNPEAWFASDLAEPLSWQRSMLESHWLLDAPERHQEQTDEEAQQSGRDDGEAETPVRQVFGTKRKNRVRRRHVLPGQAEEQDARDEDVAQVVARSSLSARARRRALRGVQRGGAVGALGSLSKLNLQTACLEQLKSQQGDGSRPMNPKEKDPVLLSPGQNTAETPEDVQGSQVWSFMRDIGFAKLLTKEEEVELSMTFRAAESLKQKKAKIEKMTGREVSHSEWAYHSELTLQQLRERLRAGEKARERLIAANMRLVVSVVKKYTRQGVLVSDLITAGTMGLAKGVDRFDPSRGFKLSTYVHWWIRQAVTRAAAEHVGAFRLPMHVHETLAKIKKVKNQLAEEGQSLTPLNIANSLGVSEKRISKVHKLKLSTKSLDDSCPCPVPFSEGSSFHNFIFDPEEEIQAWTQIEAMLLKKDIASIMLSKLDARERDIICMHYGLKSKDGVGITLDNISLRYGVSRERIRQVETVAIRKLRALCANKDLKRYCY